MFQLSESRHRGCQCFIRPPCQQPPTQSPLVFVHSEIQTSGTMAFTSQNRGLSAGSSRLVLVFPKPSFKSSRLTLTLMEQAKSLDPFQRAPHYLQRNVAPSCKQSRATVQPVAAASAHCPIPAPRRPGARPSRGAPPPRCNASCNRAAASTHCRGHVDGARAGRPRRLRHAVWRWERQRRRRRQWRGRNPWWSG